MYSHLRYKNLNPFNTPPPLSPRKKRKELYKYSYLIRKKTKTIKLSMVFDNYIPILRELFEKCE